MRVLKHLCRELLLLESSDWQFLITTGAARDYAEQRFAGHLQSFKDLRALGTSLESAGALTADEEARLTAIELADNIFPDIDPRLWAAKRPAPALRALPQQPDPTRAAAAAPASDPS